MGQIFAANAALSRTDLSRAWNEQFSQQTTLSNPATSLNVPTLLPGAHQQSNQPHPAVARIIVPEGGATSYGSGTLIDARDQFGLVITNWHVVRDSQGDVEVVFPNGFTSKARALKVDADWDLAALVIWRPQIQPVTIAQSAPQPGDQLTICGYGQGMYRAATGRCTQYYAPRLDFPKHMVELDVEARQGDSGGPIFNHRGELAGVLFGAGQGTTLGSFGGRVESFLATLAPDIGQTSDVSLAKNDAPPVLRQQTATSDPFVQAEVKLEPKTQPEASPEAPVQIAALDTAWQSSDEDEIDTAWPDSNTEPAPQITRQQIEQQTTDKTANWQSVPQSNRFEQIKTVLAAIGIMALAVLVLRAAR